MSATDTPLYSLNSGEVSRLALARADLAKLKMAAEVQTNFLPHVLGPAMMRPGTAYIAGVASDAVGWLGEFYFDETTKALLVATSAGLRFLLSGVYLTRVAVTAAVTNGTFNANLAGWTNADESGATSAWLAGGYMSLVGTGTNYAYRDQQVAVTETGTEHALRVIITHGTVTLQVGTVAGDNAYIDVSLLPGTYSLAFTPTGDFWIRLGANNAWASTVDSIAVEGAGIVSLPVPWSSVADFDAIRYDQSGDVLFLASKVQQRRIERRKSDSRSWGIALYQSDNGPFRLVNTGAAQLSPSDVHGSVTISATKPVFKSNHVGALFRLTHSGQSATATLGGANQFTGTIRVSGLTNSATGSTRVFAITVDGTFVATVTLQRSIGTPGSWTDVESYTTTQSKNYDDGLDNQIVYYRLGIKAGAYTSGSAVSTLNYAGSSQTGVCRITAFTNSESVTADVLTQFGATGTTDNWSEGEWSDYRGWPEAVALHDGRLWWQAGIKIQGSISDAFDSFDDTTTGDSGPINRTIATGGLDGGRWLLSVQRLLVGTAAQEISIRASAFDEPLTPTAMVARACSTRGGAAIRALRVDAVGIFVARDSKRVFELAYEVQVGDYRSAELSRLKQEMCAAGVRSIAVQRQPDTRIWFVLGDGTCAVLTYEREDEVVAWVPVTTLGTFERVAVLPGSDEDEVYFIVARTIGGGTKRFVERLAKRTECQGGTLNKTIDCHVSYTGGATNTIAAAHLIGQSVVAWADGAPRITADAPVTVSGGGNATLPGAPATNAVVGLPYTAQLKTVKLAYAAEHGTALTLPKRVARVGLVMADVGWKGVRIGRDFSNLSGLPATYKGRPLAATEVLAAWDQEPGAFNGGWNSDARFCVQVQSPYPATLMGLVLQMETNEPNPPDPAPSNGR